MSNPVTRTQRFLNSKMVPPGQLGDGDEYTMSQEEFDAFIAEAKVFDKGLPQSTITTTK